MSTDDSNRVVGHPSASELVALARGEEGHEAARIHVEKGCAACATRLREAAGREMPPMKRLLRRLWLDETPAERAEVGELVERTRAWSSLGKSEEASAAHLAAELLVIPEAQRRQRIRHGGRFASRGLVLLLVERAREEGFRDPKRAVDLANLALEVAEVLEAGGMPAGVAADAQALAWAMVSNAHRVQGQLVEAERAMASAKRLLSVGAGEAGFRAEILSLEGSLRTDEGRFEEANTRLEEAAGLFLAAGDGDREGKILMQLGNVAGESGDAEAAVEHLTRACEVLAQAGSRRLELCARQSLAKWLRTAGLVDRARHVYDELAPAFLAEIDDPSSRLRLEWLGGELSIAEGDVERGEEILLGVREAYGERDEVYRFCLVSLELAALYLSQGRTADVRMLAEQMIPVFASHQVHHHALAALALFQQAVERDRATAEVAAALASYLERAQRNPYLRFEGLSEPS